MFRENLSTILELLGRRSNQLNIPMEQRDVGIDFDTETIDYFRQQQLRQHRQQQDQYRKLFDMIQEEIFSKLSSRNWEEIEVRQYRSDPQKFINTLLHSWCSNDF